ncbi:MAG: SOS response-associated peptidase [Candidatus Cloacimonetes bacterium]|nr:SOS response-associated peptidase [Candidatus Cloacimonadota bacterium]MCF7813631.1 SOS response-associated peptidase [Candidatus Cloacimonadota bacterium]MCF7868310.1 SOS response-associated peptidase [Candidatus Cloacimonadota bacterium]MCF7883785.1 SOS response-associated peptidase [Candidatus Cloacimonadota bacterium]
MCGRFALYSSFSAIKEYADILNKIGELESNFNVAPGQIIPIVMTVHSKKILEPVKWGLVPFWAKDPKIGYRMINTRAETINQKPSFKAAFRYRRCLIPANGFYEWKKPEKQPYFIHLKDRELFTFAGIWEEWHHPDGSSLRTCSIITTQANEIMREIHDRMPVILPRQDEEKWLQQNEQKELLNLLKPYISDDMEIYPVSKAVNSYKNNYKHLLKEV